jgi:hypothetical protein
MTSTADQARAGSGAVVKGQLGLTTRWMARRELACFLAGLRPGESVRFMALTPSPNCVGVCAPDVPAGVRWLNAVLFPTCLITLDWLLGVGFFVALAAALAVQVMANRIIRARFPELARAWGIVAVTSSRLVYQAAPGGGSRPR